MKTKILLILLLISNNLFSQNIETEKIDNFLTYIKDNNGGIGSISIYKDEKEVYSKNFGQDKLTDVNFDIETKYQIASVTKIVTGILIFDLIENNQLKLNDKLSDYYPEIPNSNKITIKNMLEHTSGLGNMAFKDGVFWLSDKVTDNEILDLIIKQGVTFEPNEKVLYSNSGYILLRLILEKKHKKEFHKIVYEKIVKPLKLKNFASIKSNPTNVFKSYKFIENWDIIKEVEFSNIIGVGDCVSTTKDLNILITSLFQYKILKKETLELMKPIIGKENWGRGLKLFEYEGLLIVKITSFDNS